ALALAHAGDAAATVQALGTLRVIWGEALPDNTQWLALVARQLDRIHRLGVLAALAQLQAELDHARGAG
ncbi:MAG: hypothetical protein Q7T39_15150, partial [Polaromonas sp.]|nr:hypothetical protein [Polaromonas sp.]